MKTRCDGFKEDIMIQFKNVREIINNSAKVFPDNLAFKVKLAEKTYDDITFTRLKEEVEAFGSFLIKEGLQGKRVAVIGKNSYNWMLVFLAVLSIDSVIVPLDRGLLEDELNDQLRRSEADAIFYTKPFEDKISDEHNLYKVCMEDEKFGECLSEGMKLDKEEYNNIEVDAEKMSILIFTSGTTSKSKAVMLSQKNLCSNISGLNEWEKFYPTDVNMAILPLHHAFGMVQVVLFISTGVCNVFCEGLRIAKCLNEYGVSILVGVPLIIETIYKTVIREIEKQNKTKKVNFVIKLCKTLDKLHIDVKRKIFAEIIGKLGGKLRLIISGAAPIDPVVAKWFNDVGIVLIQGYGLSETAPVVSAENPEHIRNGSIGFPLPGYEVKIIDADENGIGEIITKGDNVMLGYYKDEENTAKVLVDGWFHTGDMGYIDKDGYIFITGRKKNVIVLNNGKNVFPEELESLMAGTDYIKECVVYNRMDDGKDLICAKVVYDSEKYKDKAEVEKLVKEKIEEVNTKLVSYKQIRDFELTDVEMDKTTTGKIKRH